MSFVISDRVPFVNFLRTRCMRIHFTPPVPPPRDRRRGNRRENFVPDTTIIVIKVTIIILREISQTSLNYFTLVVASSRTKDRPLTPTRKRILYENGRAIFQEASDKRNEYLKQNKNSSSHYCHLNGYFWKFISIKRKTKRRL